MIALSFATLTACAATETKTEPVPCPPYPELLLIEDELVKATPKRVISITVQNYLLLDEYIQKLEVRAECR